MSRFVDPTTFDASRVVFQAVPSKLKMGILIKATYNGEAIRYKLPTYVNAPFGISKGFQGEGDQLALTVAVAEKEGTEGLKSLCKSLDQAALAHVIKNANTIFGTEGLAFKEKAKELACKEDSILEKFSESLKSSDDGKYAPKMRLKIGKIFTVYTKYGKKIEDGEVKDRIKERSEVKPVIAFSGLFLNSKTISTQWFVESAIATDPVGGNDNDFAGDFEVAEEPAAKRPKQEEVPQMPASFSDSE